ncbi:type IV pilus modification protein PilV [Neisseria sp. Ec49-e6-T10]|uniref:type IV pilus modification protein PilV n=1 Tax=Neisseria sp. Ec49-e6-T10 TaxID=3140744 RepID=UPI003EBA2727
MIKMKNNLSIYKLQAGATLLEILLSVFILSFGLLALLSMQLKTYSGIREAEYSGVVSTLAESMAEAMRGNPHLNVGEIASNPLLVTRDWQEYTNYTSSSNVQKHSTTTTLCSVALPSATAMTKTELAQYQVCQFTRQLKQQLPVNTAFEYRICKANAKSTTKPKLGALGCDDSGKDTMIKIAWKVSADAETAAELGGSAAEKTLGYGYQLVINN